jgi:HlyD family secretion protein
MDRPLAPEIPQRQRRRRLALGGTAACVAVVAYLWLPSIVGPAVSRDRIRTARVERGVVDATIAATGLVVPEIEQVLASPVDARVLRVLERPGAHLTAGQPILELDVSQARLDVDKITQDLAIKANAQAQKRLALDKSLIDLDSRTEIKRLQLASLQSQLARDRQLSSQGLLSVEQLKKSELATSQAEIELKQITAERANAREATHAELEGLDLEIGKLRKEEAEAARQLTLASPRAGRDGVLTWVVTEEGAAVTKGQPLARVADFRSFRVDASISDVYARQLRVGLPAVVVAGEQRFEGTVAEVNPTVSNGVMTVVIALQDRSNPTLRSNLRTDVEIVTARKADAIRVQRGPFATGEGSADVFVVRGDRAVHVPVTFGLSSQTYFEVTSGLTPGDEVIVSDMRDYLRVREVRLR